MGDRHTLSLKGQSVADMDQVGAERASGQTRKPIEWEYNVRFPKAGEPSINELKPLGEQGWELCAVINGAEFIYKRRKQS